MLEANNSNDNAVIANGISYHFITCKCRLYSHKLSL